MCPADSQLSNFSVAGKDPIKRECALWLQCLTCPSEVALDHVKPVLYAALHLIEVVQHASQGAVHALQLVHQVSVVLGGLILILQKLYHTVVYSATYKKICKHIAGGGDSFINYK